MLYSTDLKQMRLVCPKAADFLESHEIDSLSSGRFDLGQGDYVNVSSYETKRRDEARYETHERYIDIQVVASGRELVEVAAKDLLLPEGPYDEESDIAFYSSETPGRGYVLEPGCFLMLMPEDGHMPGLAVDTEAKVTKAVFKIGLA